MTSVPLLDHEIPYCLDPSRESRETRKNLWSEFLRSVCHDDAVKWRNQCAALLRRIRRIRDTMDNSALDEGVLASLSPRSRESAIEEYSIATGLDYEQSKLMVLQNRTLLPKMDEHPVSFDLTSFDPAFRLDVEISSHSFWCKLRVVMYSNSLWILLASSLVQFVVEQTWFAALPLILLIVFALPNFPYAPSVFFKVLFASQLLLVALKLLWQLPMVCDLGTEAGPFLFRIARKCPPVYIDSLAMHLGLFKTRNYWSLLWTNFIFSGALLVHLRSMFLTGRFALAPRSARLLIGGQDEAVTRPTHDTYTTRFVLGMCVTVILVTNWATISSSKLPQIGGPSNFLGEAVTRNNFSAWQVLAITLFVFQLIFDRAIYIAMSHTENFFFLRKLIRISVLVQLVLLLGSMNLRLVFRFFLPYMSYLILSARQLAFDVRPVGNKSGFLWDKGYFSYYAYRLYLAIPFLDELRQICDWVATPATSLSLFMWFKVEDCISNLRFIQAEMDSRQRLPFRKPDRMCIGISALVGLVAILTGPLVFFSGLNVLREENPIVDGNFEIYFQLAQLPRIPAFSSNQITYRGVNSEQVIKDDEILAPLLVLQSADLQTISFPENSDSDWALSVPLKTRLIAALAAATGNVTVTAQWTLARDLYPPSTSLVTRSVVNAKQLLAVIQNETSELEVTNLIPSVVYLDSSASAKIINEKGMKSGISLQLNVDRNGHQWWSLVGDSEILCLAERTIAAASSSGVSAYSFSVIGLYLGVVLTVGRFLRLSLQGSSKRIDVEELPATETLMQLCQGIEIARIFKDTETEKRLYYDLVKVFRDPQLLMAATGKSVAPNDNHSY